MGDTREFAGKMGRRIDTDPRKTMEALQTHPWPGNVRALSGAIERAMILSTGSGLELGVPSLSRALRTADLTRGKMERRQILQVLDKTGWRVSDNRGAAQRLGLIPTTLEYRWPNWA